jgi:hypothetical protein
MDCRSYVGIDPDLVDIERQEHRPQGRLAEVRPALLSAEGLDQRCLAAEGQADWLAAGQPGRPQDQRAGRPGLHRDQQEMATRQAGAAAAGRRDSPLRPPVTLNRGGESGPDMLCVIHSSDLRHASGSGGVSDNLLTPLVGRASQPYASSALPRGHDALPLSGPPCGPFVPSSACAAKVPL